MPKVSVIIPAYNSDPYLSDTLDSVLAQTYTDFEIIVVDDGSTDSTRDLMQTYVKRSSGKIRYIYQENGGPAKARNRGIRESSGEYLAFIDSDDLWVPSSLEEKVKALDSNPSVDLVHGNIAQITKSGKFIREPKREKRFLSGSIFEYLFLRKAHVACPTVLLRKRCLDQAGLFDEANCLIGCEDRDLWLRIAQRSKVLYLDKVLAHYRVREESISRNEERMVKARSYIVDKFCRQKENEYLRKPALGKIYRDLADEFLFKGDFSAAQGNYWKSISFMPFAFWSWVNFLKAVFKIKVQQGA